MKLLLDFPTTGEPHYAEAIPASLVESKSIKFYKLEDNHHPYVTKSEKDAKVVRDGNRVDVYMTAIRSHLAPDNIEGIKMGDEVYFHVTNLEQDWDVPHGFAVKGANNAELLDHARRNLHLEMAARPRRHRRLLLHGLLLRAAPGNAGIRPRFPGRIRNAAEVRHRRNRRPTNRCMPALRLPEVMKKLRPITRILLAIAALAMASGYYLPLWEIQLWAPQYPEGLNMKIWLNHLSGAFDIINGLNHYIGMKQIKQEMFPEFHYMGYVLGFPDRRRAWFRRSPASAAGWSPSSPSCSSPAAWESTTSTAGGTTTATTSIRMPPSRCRA